MTWQSHTVSEYLWCLQPLMVAAVAVTLWRRKLYKRFPVFFVFLLAQIANFAVVFPLWQRQAHMYKLYFEFFWLGEAINAVLGFKVIHEIFIDVFRPYHTLKDLGTLLFKWAGVVMLLVSVVVAFSNSIEQSPLVHAITTLQQSVRIVQLGLILFLLLFSRFLGVSRKQVSFGVSLGFGLIAGAELMLIALSAGGFVKTVELDPVNMLAYNVALLVWLGYALSPQAARETSINHLQTKRWEQGLADLQQSVPSDSLIPMFEGMVERAFSRSSSMENAEDLPLERSTVADLVAARVPAKVPAKVPADAPAKLPVQVQSQVQSQSSPKANSAVAGSKTLA